MKLIQHDSDSHTPSSPPSAAEIRGRMASPVGDSGGPALPNRSGINNDVDLARAFDKAIVARAEVPIPVASNIAAEEAERRRHLLDRIRVKSSAMTVAAGRKAMEGILWGGVSRVGLLLLRGWLRGGRRD